MCATAGSTRCEGHEEKQENSRIDSFVNLETGRLEVLQRAALAAKTADGRRLVREKEVHMPHLESVPRLTLAACRSVAPVREMNCATKTFCCAVDVGGISVDERSWRAPEAMG